MKDFILSMTDRQVMGFVLLGLGLALCCLSLAIVIGGIQEIAGKQP